MAGSHDASLNPHSSCNSAVGTPGAQVVEELAPRRRGHRGTQAVLLGVHPDRSCRYLPGPGRRPRGDRGPAHRLLCAAHLLRRVPSGSRSSCRRMRPPCSSPYRRSRSRPARSGHWTTCGPSTGCGWWAPPTCSARQATRWPVGPDSSHSRTVVIATERARRRQPQLLEQADPPPGDTVHFGRRSSPASA